MSNFTLHHGDALDVLRGLPAASINCCVTSPPYYGLRDYGVNGQIGLEPTPDEYVARLVGVFREVRRVLRDDGTLWLNLGDSYAMSTKGSSGKGDKQISNAGTLLEDRRWRVPEGLKQKDLIGIPWLVAFALRADGWYLRSEIIWHKPNPMPESVRDRPTKAHEQIFLLSKSPKYYYDADAVKEASAQPERAGKVERSFSTSQSEITLRQDIGRAVMRTEYRNRRSVWTVTPKPYKEAHFATFPPDLIEPCILAGCPEGGTVLDPFGGSGTTAQVAIQNRRNALLIELNANYIELIKKRLEGVVPMSDAEMPLFAELEGVA